MRIAAVTALFVLVLATVACSSAPKPDRLPPQTMSSAPSLPVDDEIGPDPREPIPEAAPEPVPKEERSPVTVVIEDGADDRVRRRSLVEAAAEERKRREASGGSTRVITDKNLGEFRGGQLTEMQQATGEAAPPPAAKASDGPTAVDTSSSGESPSNVSAGDPAGPSEGDEEAYWRGRVRQARMNWAAAVEENRRLKSKVAELRQRFYAEEDPYYRDSQIKPSWDRALDRLEETRESIEEYRIEVRNVLEAGRRASALPGWLREGIDLEPDIIERDREEGPSPPGEYLPGEPKVAADPDGRR